MASGMFMTASAVDTFNTRGNGEIYTLESLMEHTKAGITKEDGAYVMSNIIVVDANDGFSIEPGAIVKMKTGVQVEVKGTAFLDIPADKRVTITRYSDTDTPKGIYMHSDVAESKISNIDFEYAQLRNFGTKGMEVDNCTFSKGNTKLNSTGALSYGKCEFIKVTNCKFTDNERGAIGGAGNLPTALYVDNCEFAGNSAECTSMRPDINVSTAADNEVVIRNCRIAGTNNPKIGGISVVNVMGIKGSNKVLIENCYIHDAWYGINIQGDVSAVIKNNEIHGCTVNKAGEAISEGISISSGSAIISGNNIHDNVIGVLVYGTAEANLGQIGNNDSPGKNVFSGNDKGESGAKIDLQVKTEGTTYAQNNVWDVENQTEEEIAQVIRVSDQSEVIYMPAGNPEGGVDAIVDDSMKPYVSGNELHIPGMADGEISVYALDGKVAAVVPVIDGTASLDSLATGALYIVTAGDYVVKIRR